MRSNVKKVILLFMLCLLVFSLTGCLKSDEAVVKSTANKFFQAVKNEDINTIRNLFGLQMYGREELIAFYEEWFSLVRYISITPTITNVSIQSGIASVNAVTIEIFTAQAENHTWTGTYQLLFSKNGNKWYITDFSLQYTD